MSRRMAEDIVSKSILATRIPRKAAYIVVEFYINRATFMSSANMDFENKDGDIVAKLLIKHFIL